MVEEAGDRTQSQMWLNHAVAEGDTGLPPVALLGRASGLHVVDQVRPFPRPMARSGLSLEPHLARHRPLSIAARFRAGFSFWLSMSSSSCRTRSPHRQQHPAYLFSTRLASIYSPSRIGTAPPEPPFSHREVVL
jgi:hypothetical protein